MYNICIFTEYSYDILISPIFFASVKSRGPSFLRHLVPTLPGYSATWQPFSLENTCDKLPNKNKRLILDYPYFWTKPHQQELHVGFLYHL
jgi:hypothetical protein